MRRAIAGASLALALTTPAVAGSPLAEVRAYGEQVIRILENPDLKSAERRAAVRAVALQAFDPEEAARRALGRHWHARTPAERAEFVDLFVDLLEATYLNAVDHYAGEGVRYTDEVVDGDRALVRAVFQTRRGVEVPVEARLHRRGERWRMYDVVVENVSLVANYRSQFDRVIRTASYAELVRRLKAKREELWQKREAAARPAS